MDILFTNTPSGEEPEDETWVGDNALAVNRGASFLIDDDPKKDPEKPISKASIGDAPMGMKPTENPLEVGHINLSSHGKGSSAGVDTLIAKASGLGANPLGDNPLGLSPEQLELLGLGFPKEPAPKPVSAKKEPEAKPEVKTDAKADVKPETKPEMKAEAKPETKAEPEPKKAEEPKEVSLSCIISASDDFSGGRIISGDLSFASAIISSDDSDPLSIDEDFKLLDESKPDDAPELDQKGIAPKEDDSVGLPSLETADDDDLKGLEADSSVSEEDPMGLMLNLAEAEESKGLEPADDSEEELKPLEPADDSEEELKPLEPAEDILDDNLTKDNPSENKPKAGGTEEMDPLRALLLAGGNPFGDNLKNIAPDLSFGKDALKPKHFEPMKASGPKVNAENAQENNPLGVNPFGKEVVPDFSFGKEALKPKKYEPKKPFE